MGAVMFLRKGEPQLYDKVFSNNTWEQIIEACQKNKVPDTWVVGDQKAMTINGVSYQIDIIGKNHDTYTDGSGTAPLTFQLHDCYGIKYRMNNSKATNNGGWTNCDMRNTSLPIIFGVMPTEVQSAIREVYKLTSAGSRSSTINKTADKLFLLSEIEVFGKNTWSFAGEGTQYAYYVAGNSALKTFSGANVNWWERSPKSSGSTQFCAVSSNGQAADGGDATSTVYAVSFAFCF